MSIDSLEAATQAISGWGVGIETTALCQRCTSELGEGDPVTVYAYRPVEAQRVSVARLYCRACDHRRIEHPARGCYEWLATARLVTTSDVTTQSHGLILQHVEILDESGPKEGNRR